VTRDQPGKAGIGPNAQDRRCVNVESAPASPGGLVCARCRRPLRYPTRTPSPPHLRGRVLTAVRNWPEGAICSGCYAKACETFGACDRCGVDRLLPGIGPGGQRWCTDCAGGIGDFTCTR